MVLLQWEKGEWQEGGCSDCLAFCHCFHHGVVRLDGLWCHMKRCKVEFPQHFTEQMKSHEGVCRKSELEGYRCHKLTWLCGVTLEIYATSERCFSLLCVSLLLWRDHDWNEWMILWRFSEFVLCMGSCCFLFICPTGISCLSARKLNCKFEGEGDKGCMYIQRRRGRVNSWGLLGHLSDRSKGMGTNRDMGRNNVLFDTLLPGGRKGDDSWRKHTNLFFMLGLFIQC